MRYLMVENCAFKAGISGGLGYALGGVMGLFMYGVPGAELQQQTKGLRHEWQLMKKACHSSGKNFGAIGLMFAGTECVLGQGFRIFRLFRNIFFSEEKL